MLNVRDRTPATVQRASPNIQVRGCFCKCEKKILQAPIHEWRGITRSGVCGLELGPTEFSGQRCAHPLSVWVVLDASDSSTVEAEAGGTQIQGYNLKTKNQAIKKVPFVFEYLQDRFQT